MPGADVIVAALIEKRRKPSDLQLETDDFEQIRIFQKKQEARLGLDEVRVLITLSDRGDLDAIAANFTRDRRRIFRCTDDFDLIGSKQIAADER